MREYTKDNPGCYHSALKYASELTGISVRKSVRVDWLSSLKQGKRLKYKSYDIQVVDKEGVKHPYLIGSQRFDKRGIEADHFLVDAVRNLAEFGLEIKDEGNYNDSLGGGWHQAVGRFSINGKYFAYMDCACGW